MLILVINCGSSSAKYDLFDLEKDSAGLAKGIVERIGENSSSLTHTVQGARPFCKEVSCPDHNGAIRIIKDILTDPKKGVLSDVNEVKGVGHRVVHGGEEFSGSIRITEDVLKSIEKFSSLAPLHNPPALEGIKGCMEAFPKAVQAAVFDTAFHHSMPEHAFFYAIPYRYYKKYGIRKYGFHGTSHRYVSEKAAEVLKKSVNKLNLITVHLGNGCSITAVAGGRSIDTSMGFTPLEGLVMGTRSGDIDPAVVAFLVEKENLSVDKVIDLLNKKSGLLGVSGVSNDMRDILKAMADGSKLAHLAYDIFVYRIKKYIGAYAAVLGRVDAVVFTAGIGENVPAIKEKIMKDLKGLFGDKTKFLIIKTNEELLIARDTHSIVMARREKQCLK